MSKLVDPRQPRMGQAITGTVLLIGFVLGWPAVLPVLAVVLAGASVGGPITNLYAWIYRGARRVLKFGPPAGLEEIGPPRFANTLGFLFLTTASILYFGAHSHRVAWSLGRRCAARAVVAWMHAA